MRVESIIKVKVIIAYQLAVSAYSVFCILLCSANYPFNDSRDSSYFTGSGSVTFDAEQRMSLTEKVHRQQTRLQVHLGEEGVVDIGRQRCCEVVEDVFEDRQSVLDVVPDGADAECVVELRTCSSCWIKLTATLDRFEQSKDATVKDNQHLMSVNNDSKSNVVTCQLWSVVLCIKVIMYSCYGTPCHSYGVSLAIWDHTALPATRHK